VRLAVAATPDVAIPTLEWLLHSEHELVCVITQPDRPSGRGQKKGESPVSLWAEKYAIHVVKPVEPLELESIVEKLDLVITIGYGVILPERILNLPKFGFLNLHFSLLPAYRGAAPVQRALENGELVTGVSVFRLDKGLDTGPIFVQEEIVIESSWRTVELLNELSALGVQALAKALQMIKEGINPKPQEGDFSIAPKISKLEAKIDFELSAKIIVQKIKAFTFEPGAWTFFNQEPFKITRAQESYGHQGSPGEILVVGQNVHVCCGNSSSIEILEVTPSGKREMKAIDWSRGARLNVGKSFG
jgi:methionyl-tRNA formyltransferase